MRKSNNGFGVFVFFFCWGVVVSKEVWEQLMKSNGWNPVELRDTRYNQIIHMVSAAKGAEDFYTVEVIDPFN